ncbi:MAG: MBL fold metallo-hydrolase [Firmicutes bacterium]|nr:MBL fold metallo-hydrolase [Bacillota bacterium]
MRKIAGSTYVIETGITVPVYFLSDKEVVLLDSSHIKYQEQILQEIEGAGLKVKAIINSHVHYDHVGNNDYFREHHGAMVITGQLEATIARSIPLVKTYYWTGTVNQIAENYKVYPMTIDATFAEEESVVEVCGAEFKIIPLPGHTPGQCGIVTPDDVFYVADALMDEDMMMKSKLPITMDWEVDFRTKEKIRDSKHAAYVLAHSGVFETIEEIVDKNVEDRMKRLARLKELLAAKDCWTREELTQVLWDRLGLRTDRQVSQVIFTRNIECIMTYLVNTGELTEGYEKGIFKYRRG